MDSLCTHAHTHTHTPHTFSFPLPLLVRSIARSVGGGRSPPTRLGGAGGAKPPRPRCTFSRLTASPASRCATSCAVRRCAARAFLLGWCVGVASTIYGKQIGGPASFWMRGTPLSRGSFCALRPLPSLAVGWWRWAIRTWDAGQPRVRDAGPPKRPRPDVAIPPASR